MDPCKCLALCVGCIVCVFRMDDYIDNMDKERRREMMGTCVVSLLPRVENLVALC